MRSLKRNQVVVSNYHFRKDIDNQLFHNLSKYNMNVTTLFFNCFRFERSMVYERKGRKLAKHEVYLQNNE